MKYVVIIGDGMADNPVPKLGGKTPLETAKIPFIDSLAQKGQLGTVRTVPVGIAPGSDTAILNIFGYDPRKFYSGRSPLEAAGAGVKLHAGDVSYRCNMVALGTAENFEDSIMLSHSAGSIDGESSIALIRALQADKTFAVLAKQNGMIFHESPSFRHIAVQKGFDIAGLVAAPPHDYLDKPITNILPKGCLAAKGLSEMMCLAHTILQNHPINKQRIAKGKLPANGIWFWAEGTAVELPDFYKEHKKNGLVVSAVPLVRGIGALCGMEYVEIAGATGELDTNFEAKVNATFNALKNGKDIVFLHLEAPDECTHNGDLDGKIQAIEWLDSRCIALLVKKFEQENMPHRLLILSDHKTLTSTRGHDAEPVPFVLYDSTKKLSGGGPAYTEANGLKGEIVEDGSTIIKRLLA